MRNIVISTAIQLVLGWIIVFLGWDILYNIVKPMGKNWMWISEMKLSFSVLAVLIVFSNIASKENKSLRILSFVVQFILVLIYAIVRFSIFPYRSMFLLGTYTIFIASIFPISALLKRMKN